MVPAKIPVYLEEAFSTGFTKTDADKDVFTFSMVEVGKLNVAKGKIIACDPICLYFEDPFIDDFPIGQFPVELAIAKINNEDECVGYARIKFSESRPVRWQLALTEGQDMSTLENDEYFGYGVDSGTGSFMDISGYQEYDELYKDEEAFNEVTQRLKENYKDTRTWLLWQGSEGNAALFSSGYGDGLYATYVGFDAAGKICRLVTDFALMDL